MDTATEERKPQSNRRWAYVIFRTHPMNQGCEQYVDDVIDGKIILSPYREYAKEFPSARDAYYWAADRRLDWWKVGVR